MTQDPTTFDPWQGRDDFSIAYTMVMEGDGQPFWALDRKTFKYDTMNAPAKYSSPQLAESWEQPDLQTVILHVRKGVSWQNIAPVNGRELTADDIAYSWARQDGLGYGFTKPSPYVAEDVPLKSVTVTDKYTVVFKSVTASTELLTQIAWGPSYGSIVARDAVEKWGSLQDWKNAVGTGPFMIYDYARSSSITYVRNPTYWGYDERHPENKLPYVDRVKVLIIPDNATALAALRSGKIDYIENQQWQTGLDLKKTNPELIQSSLLGSASTGGIQIRCDKAPFTDIRVRTALQMALDLDTIAKTFYGGTTQGIPYGLIGPLLPDYYTPYTQWPKAVQDGFAYNPEGAKKLLAEAGYPKGFKTNLSAPSNADLDLAQIVKSYFANIGVEMEIKTMEPTAWRNFAVLGKSHDQLAWYHTGAYGYPLIRCLFQRSITNPVNITMNNNPVFEKMYSDIVACLDATQLVKLIKEADAYATAQHWVVNLFPTVTYNINQPWLKGYSGELMHWGGHDHYFARFWIDQSLKKAE